MGNTAPKRSADEQSNAGDGSVRSNSIMVGSPMDDSSFVFPDHDLLGVSPETAHSY